MTKNFKGSKLTALRRSKRSDHQQGFNLVELMITLAVGVILFAGVMSVFVGMRTTTAETSSYGELQENARFALSVLTDDLLQQNFWGDYTGSLNFSSLSAIPGAPVAECQGGGLNNGTYPVAPLVGGAFRTLWGETSDAGGNTAMSCIANGVAAPNSDVIQLKRVISRPLVPPVPVGFSYFVGNTDGGAIFQAPVPIIPNNRTWQYQHHIYYVQQQNAAAIPVLMQWRLTTQMTESPIIDGIERIYFMYGVSTVTNPLLAGFDVVNAYVSAASMTAPLWDNSRIIAVKIYVLARSILPDMKYTNENTYTLGDQAAYTPNDNFRRLLLSSTVTLYNSGI